MRPASIALTMLLSTLALQAFAEQGDAQDRALIEQAAMQRNAATPKQATSTVNAAKKDDSPVTEISYPKPASAP